MLQTTSMAANNGRFELFFKRQQTKNNIKVKLEQYVERTPPYTILLQLGLGPYDYRTIENPKYQSVLTIQTSLNSQRKVLKRTKLRDKLTKKICYSKV